MHYHFLHISVVILLSSFILQSQVRDCFTDDYMDLTIKSDPSILKRIEQIERHTAYSQTLVSARNSKIISIPVVVHVVYKELLENITDEQIKSQIEVLNQDFRRLNIDANNKWPQASDMDIEFCLSSVDPTGKPTSGITRTYTSYSSFTSASDNIKYTNKGGKDAWSAENYLNIWVGNITGTVLGYAQFPGGKPETDGVVIDYKVFGKGTYVTPGFHLGRTTTHEVGHWLNLRHIWGAADCVTDDLVSDTPLSAGPNYGCAKGQRSCGSLDMVENYMDYSDDDCVNLFTAGQKTRMQALFNPGGFRFGITKSNGCGIPDPVGSYCGKIRLAIQFDNYPQETSWEIKEENGKTIIKSQKYQSSQKGTVLKIDTCLVPGCYTLNIYDTYNDGICCKYGQGNYKFYSDDKLIGEGATFGKSAVHNFCIINNQATCFDGLKNGNETGTDCGGATCLACPNCYDGIRNADETDIDCGGKECVPCPTNPQNPQAYLLASYFETGWDHWTGGVTDTERYKGDFSWEGDYSIMIRDDCGNESAMTSPELDLRSFERIKIEFAFYSYSMEGGEEFWLMYHDGVKWNTLKSFASGKDFFNSNFYEVTFLVDAAQYNFVQKGKFRFQCNASTNADQIYIDAVKISGIQQNAKQSHEYNKINTVGYYIGPVPSDVNTNFDIFPNPAEDIVTLTSDVEITLIKISDMSGNIISIKEIKDDNSKIDLSLFPSGLYIIIIQTEDATISKRLIKK